MANLIHPLPSLGFGAFKIGRNSGTKYESNYGLPDERESSTLLNAVLDLGINLIDTAPAYGMSEERIGRAIAHRRHEFTLSTKVGERFEHGVSKYDFSEKAVRASIDHSLQRLRTDVIDLMFIHASRDDLRVLRETEVVPTLISLRESGKVRAIGLSGYSADTFRESFVWADAIMATYHHGDRGLAPVMAEAHTRGIVVIVKKGLASGRLPADEAIRFVLANSSVHCMVVGSLSTDHMRANWSTAQAVRCQTPPVSAPTPSG